MKDNKHEVSIIRSSAAEYLTFITATGEGDENSVIRKFRITVADGKMYNTNHYNLNAIIAVGNKVDSPRAVQFRKWANHIIEEYTPIQQIMVRQAMWQRQRVMKMNVRKLLICQNHDFVFIRLLT